MSLFWKPGSAPSTNSTLLLDNDGNDTTIPLIDNNRNQHHNQSNDDLPIAKHRRQILYSMERYKVIVIVGETGSGKSTQIPQYLLSSGWASPPFRILITQPRRIAAITLASHVSSRLPPTSPPSTCSHLVRFSSTVDPTTTRVIFATDGMVVREALVDPLLSRYSVVVVDEAHERGLNSDVLLGLLKKIRRKRNDLRVVICSASIDARAFLDYFCKTKKTTTEGDTATGGGGGSATTTTTTKRKRRRLWSNVAPTENDDENDSNGNDDGIGTIISIDGRQHPVDILYSEKPVSDYITATVDTCIRIHLDESSGDDDGDILCFLPSGEDIDRAIRLTDDKLRARRSDNPHRPLPPFPSLLPLYGSLPYHLQTRIFAPQRSSSHRRRRRIIFSTNMAETSVTVPHVAYVVDCGLVKLPYFDPSHGFERLVTAPISRASAIQRAGRAGRVRPGTCFRLYTEEGMRRVMVAATPPEMTRANLTGFVLTLAALGVEDLRGFDLMGEPRVEGVRHALEVLYALGAIDEGEGEEGGGGRCRLTNVGSKMCEFPCDPRVAKMLLYSMEVGCAEDVLTVAAVLQVRDLMVRPKGDQQMLDFEECLSDVVDAAGDHVTYLNIMERDWDKGERECRDVFVNYLAVKRAKEVRAQLRRFLRRYGQIRRNDGVGDEERSRRLRKCVTAGFFFNVAKLESDGRYYTLKGKHVVKITAMSVLKRYGESKEYMVFGETFDGSKGGLEVRHCSLIEGKWLRELAPHYWA